MTVNKASHNEMGKSIENYLPLSRGFFKNDLWKEQRSFSKAEAWIWLIQKARYSPGSESTVVWGRRVHWKRGELTASIRFLRDIWGWGSNDKVSRFLNYLQEEEMITTDTSQGQTVITLTNYHTYNPAWDEEVKPTRTEQGLINMSDSEAHDDTTQPEDAAEAKPETPSQPKGNKTSSQSDLKETTDRFIDLWNDKTGKSLRYTRKKQMQVRQRLKSFSEKEIETAIRNRASDKWIRENDQLHNWDATFRNDNAIEKWLNRTSKSSQNGHVAANALSLEEAKQLCEAKRLEFSLSYFNMVKVKGENKYVPTI